MTCQLSSQLTSEKVGHCTGLEGETGAVEEEAYLAIDASCPVSRRGYLKTRRRKRRRRKRRRRRRRRRGRRRRR